MKIKSILSALLLMVSSVASAQYLNVKLEDGSVHSYKTTPNMKVSFGDKAGAEVTESAQTVTANGHAVTVKLAEEQMPNSANDLIISSKVTGDGKAIVEAISRSQKRLECYLDGEASCAKGTTTLVYYQPIGGLSPIIFISHVFTISNIASDITATIGYPRPTEISLTLSNHTTYAGCTFKLSATVLPDDAFNKNFTWSSSNASVATVDENGKVTAMAEGETDITVTTEVGELVATCKTTVKPFTPTLSGEFSVGPAENCKTVCFSRGNLKYTPEGDTWWFFNNQYEYGHTPEQLSLFTWGYGSWSTTWNTQTYQGGSDFVDWGRNIGDGHTWRTLSSEEWKYLFDGRTNARDKCGYATVCGIKGLIILPDVFTDPMKSKGSEAFTPLSALPSNNPQFTDNEYTAGGNWEAMETAGAVFLPAAGFLNVDQGSSGDSQYMSGDIQYMSGDCKYWHSTANMEKANEAYSISVVQGFFRSSSSSIRSDGYSVRLVRDCTQ